MRVVFILALVALLPGCNTMPPADRAGTVTCAPLQWQSLLGTRADAATLPQDLTHRIFQRGDMVTADYDEDRLNIVTNAAGTVVEVSCG